MNGQRALLKSEYWTNTNKWGSLQWLSALMNQRIDSLNSLSVYSRLCGSQQPGWIPITVCLLMDEWGVRGVNSSHHTALWERRETRGPCAPHVHAAFAKTWVQENVCTPFASSGCACHSHAYCVFFFFSFTVHYTVHTIIQKRMCAILPPVV